MTDIYVDIHKAQINGVVKCFPDDWERAMNALLSNELKRYVKLDSAVQDSLHGFYLKKHFNLTVGKQSIKLKFSGTVTGLDEIYLLFEGPMEMAVDAYKKDWMVSHSLLADIYPSQENIIILHCNGQKYTSSCRAGNDYKFNHSF